MRRAPGFLSTRLHRSVLPNARFTFINIAEWESAEHFQAVVNSDEFQQATEKGVEDFPHFPGLYTLVRT